MAVSPPLQTKKYWTDFSMNFDIHPLKKDLAMISNEDCVKQSIRNLLTTNFYERVDPTVGTNLEGSLFELISDQSQIVLQSEITKCIKNHEPRANLISVNVSVNPDSYSIYAEIMFTVQNDPTVVTLNQIIQRVR